MKNSPYFFKIILHEAIRHGRLGLPKKFITKYGTGLLSPVTLEVRSGATWQIELSNRDGEVCFENGWQEFAKYHRLEHGHLLMFEYEQPCHFYVLIFDKSATEIDYPSRPISTSEQNLDGGSKGPKSKENDDKNPSRKKRKTAPTNKTANTAASKSLLGNFRNLEAPSAFKKEFRGISIKGCTKRKLLWLLKLQINTYLNLIIHPSSLLYIVEFLNMSPPVGFSRQYFGKKVNDLTFRVADRNWSVRLLLYDKKNNSRFTSGLPVFARENSLKHGDVCVFELIESGVLNVCIFRRSDYDAFSEENDDNNSVEILDDPSANLEGGEEPLSFPPLKKMRTDTTNKTANVASKSLLGNVRNHDFPSSKKEFRGNFNKRMHKKKASLALEAASKYISESDYPSFKSVVHCRENVLNMRAPIGFSRQYFGKKVNDLTFRVADGNWPVRLLLYDKNNYTRFTSGLHVFAREISLEQGDVCVFELIESGVLNVCIFRCSDYEAFSKENDDNNSVEILDYPSANLEGGKEPLSPPPRKKLRTAPTYKTANAASKSLHGNVRNHDFPSSKKELRGNFNKRTDEKKASEALEAANKYISESDYPSFKSVWAPFGFIHQYFGKKVNDLTFQVADRNWPVRLLQYDKNKYTRFTSGLPVFGRENSLKQGDVCVFELIENGVLNVCIFRLDDDYNASPCSSDEEFGILDERMLL